MSDCGSDCCECAYELRRALDELTTARADIERTAHDGLRYGEKVCAELVKRAEAAEAECDTFKLELADVRAELAAAKAENERLRCLVELTEERENAAVVRASDETMALLDAQEEVERLRARLRAAESYADGLHFAGRLKDERVVRAALASIPALDSDANASAGKEGDDGG